MSVKRNKQKVNEFCELGHLENFREVLENMFKKINDSNCRISSRSDGGPSIHEFQSSTHNCIIRISLLKKYNDPIEIIWTILHEFGHHLSGDLKLNDRDNFEMRIAREELAWFYARKEALNYPLLSSKILDFDNYWQSCLQSYYRQNSL